MEGRIESINGARARAGALAAYLKRYPFVRDFFSGTAAVSHQVASKVSRVELYAFRPFDIWYVDNEVGFGTRWKLQIQNGKPIGDPILD